MIYLDAMASAPLDSRVREAMDAVVDAGPGNPHSTTHAPGWRTRTLVDEARRAVARLVGASAGEVVFTSGATEANNLAITGAAERTERRSVVVSAVEHPSVLGPARALEARGFSVRLAPVDGDGRVRLDELARMIDRDTALVSVMLANNEVGTIQPVTEAAALAHEAGALFHCDAVQAAGRLPVDVGRLGVDLMSLSAHKMGGPQGIGGLYVRTGVTLAPILHGGAQQGGLRAGTVPAALAHGFGVAADIACAETETDAARMSELTARLLDHLRNGIPGLVVNSPATDVLPGCLSVAVQGIDARDWLLACPELAAATGAACASGDGSPSHVLRAMGLPSVRIAGSIRLSLSRATTRDEVDRAASMLVEGLAQVAGTGAFVGADPVSQ